MRYQSLSVSYWYFAVAMVLFGLQLVFGPMSATKYIGPDPLLYILPFDVTKVIHTCNFKAAFTSFIFHPKIMVENLGQKRHL